ncbi:MAG: CBS domain-containing protein [Candidatus Promineifilaceae bacterium]|nr:CBS domain-containing protein [Candidatus Promineifilaceae bacterium]
MLVKERMSQPVVTVTPEMPIMEALQLMKKQRIRRTPVVKDGQLVGIISDRDLLNASPSDVTSLSVWEINYLLGQIHVEEVMTRDVITVDVSTPLEVAARLMADNSIGGIPVTDDGEVVGLITETDLFKIFLEILGAREPGLRVSAMVPERPGTLARLTRAVADAGGDFMSFGVFYGEDSSNREVTFKVTGVDEATLRRVISPLVERVVDVRASG